MADLFQALMALLVSSLNGYKTLIQVPCGYDVSLKQLV
jgi:hypothetical protein